MNNGTSLWLSQGFRPFFALGSLYAMVVIVLWVAYLLGGWPIPVGWSPLHWHSHEMIYGWPSAAIAGFLLTAVPNWTGSRPLSGRALLTLVELWVIGRVVFLTAAVWPAPWVAVIDLAFPLALAAVITATLLRYRNRRNWGIALVLIMMLAGNVLMHLGFLTGRTAWLVAGEQLGLGLVTLLMAVIAGRIVPAFTGNWLRRERPEAGLPRRLPWLDRLALGSLAALIPLDLVDAGTAWLLPVLAVAAFAHALRLALWRGWRVLDHPLLWVLHLGYAWLVAALLARLMTEVGWLSGTHLWQHLLGVGAMATLILGVMSRVALGHSGRPLWAPPLAVTSFGLITLASLLRLLAATGGGDYRWALSLSALAWVLAFGAFLAGYLPILLGRKEQPGALTTKNMHLK